MFQSQFNLLIKKNIQDSHNKIELLESNTRKFEYTISTIHHMEKVFNFLNSLPSSNPLQTINSN